MTTNPTEIIESPQQLVNRRWTSQKGQGNRKARYTRRVIREVFLALLEELPVEKITVSRICELADISRGTFYLHYHDPFDLLDCIENEFLQVLEEQISQFMAGRLTDYSVDPRFWLEVLGWLSADPDLARLFLTNPNSTLMTKCLEINRAYTNELCRQQYPDSAQAELDYMHTFYEHGSASVICQWVREGFNEPPGQIAGLLAKLNSRR